jgi:hypothetical protein
MREISTVKIKSSKIQHLKVTRILLIKDPPSEVIQQKGLDALPYRHFIPARLRFYAVPIG